jgi:2-polyprenyl-6-methoxyphenol hydroxylase-like FAD-dependent oxidoreductase
MELLIAGGGIAGLSAAIAMAKSGYSVTVAERARDIREIGAALSLWPNALAALDRLGVGEKVRSIGVESPSSSIRSQRGKTLVRFDTRTLSTALGGLPTVVLRAGLQRALLEECDRLHVNIHLRRNLDRVWTDGDTVVVRCDDSQTTFDAVIGADGFNSVVRQAVPLGDALRDCNRTAWRALIPNLVGLIIDTWLTVGVGLQFIAAPAPDGLGYWAADTTGVDSSKMSGIDALKMLRRDFGGWHDPIPEIIGSTSPDALIVNRLFDRPPPRTLHNESILLVGDAAHVMTPDLGQGACQALEDAALLLHCASVDPSTQPRALFAHFETVRLKRVRRVVRDSQRIGRMATTSSSIGARMRDLGLLLGPSAIRNRQIRRYASVRAFGRQLSA